MDSGVIVTSIGIGAAIFAGLIIFWFFHTFIKRKLKAEQSAQLPNSSQKFNGEEMRRHPRMEVSWPAAMQIRHGSIKVRLKDISLGGAFVICEDSIALNEPFRLYVEVPDEETEMSLKTLQTGVQARSAFARRRTRHDGQGGMR